MSAPICEIGPDDLPALQHFFEENPEYFLAVGGEPPRFDEAAQEFADLPPPEMTFRRKCLFGFRDESGALIAMAHVLVDFIAEGVGHIGLFIVATELHGTGAAQRLYAQLENWLKGEGAKWIRLGVVEGNARAEGLWRKLGYWEVRQRTGILMGQRINTVRVLVKSLQPLADDSFSEYLNLVLRDRPGAP